MSAKKKKLSRAELKVLVAGIVDDCQKIADQYIATWKPVDKSWPTIEGAAYLRLSTDEQVVVEKGSLEQQVYIAIAEALERSRNSRKNYKIVKFYIEPGITARNDKRPQFQQLRRSIKKEYYNFVIFKEIARVSRESQIWKQFFKLCIEKNCQICIKGFPFNPNDPAQIFLLDILAAVAEYESNLTSKRIKETNFSALVTSGKLNSTREFLGLDQLVIDGVPKVGLYVVNEDEIKIVQWIMKEFVKVPEHTRLLKKLESKGIANKGSTPFTRSTLRTLSLIHI